MEINKTNMEEELKIAQEIGLDIAAREPSLQNEMIAKIINVVMADRTKKLEDAQKYAEFLQNSIQYLHGLNNSLGAKEPKENG